MNSNSSYYKGVVTEVLDKALYEIKVDIPGVGYGVKAYPQRSELDEPKVGEVVLLRSLDPEHNSYFLFRKLKENDFIGIRSNGKIIDITPEQIKIGVFDGDSDYRDGSENYRPNPTDWIIIDSAGNLEVSMRGDAGFKITGKGVIEVDGEVEVKSSKSITVVSPKVVITGGEVEIKGQGSNDMQGPFNCLPVCPFTGAPHSGKSVVGT